MKAELKCILELKPNIYYGFVGRDNLGDEALWEATDILFKNAQLSAIKTTRFEFINKLIMLKNKNLFILGGGTLIGDNLADGTNPFRDEYIKLSKNSRTKIVFGTGVGLLKDSNRLPNWLDSWKPLLSQCDFIGVRGYRSKQTLDIIGINSEVIGDTALTWGTDKRAQVSKKLLGINIGATHGLLPDDKINTYADFVRKRYADNWELEFYVVNPSDIVLSERFARLCGVKDPKFFHFYNNTTSFLEQVKKTHCFVGTRLHSVILAMCAGVPSIMIGYADKSLDFMESIEMEKFNIQIEQLSFMKLESSFEELVTNTSAYSRRIINKVMFFKQLQQIKSREIMSNI